VVSGLQKVSAQFRLAEGLTWQDGTPVSAEDSVFSAKVACDPASGLSTELCERTASYEASDDRTVTWTSIPGYTDQTYFANFYTPIARHQPSADGRPMEDLTPAELAADEEMTRRPYSYGPFQVADWVAGDHIELTANPRYWRAGDDSLPFLDTVIYKFYPDSDALLKALLSGDADVAAQDALSMAQYDQLEKAKADGTLQVAYLSGPSWEHIDFQVAPPEDRPALGACIELRQAVALGTNRDAMVQEVLHGTTDVRQGIVPANHWAYPSAPKTWTFDPAAAGTLLEDLGFRDANGDGTREAQREIVCSATAPDGSAIDARIPAGTELALTLVTTEGDEVRQRTTDMFTEDMAEIGVAVDVKTEPAETLFASSGNGPLASHAYDLAQFAWLTGTQPHLGLFTCASIPAEDTGWVGQNSTGWCNPAYDALANKAATQLSREDAVATYGQAQALLAEELPVLPLFGRVMVAAARADLLNYAPSGTASADTWNIETWGLPPAR
jgi:peptide/nickel transport system substrate-binding protein